MSVSLDPSCLAKGTKDCGLGTAYKNDDAVFKYIKKIMALPFLPHEHTRPMFETLNDLVTSSLLQSLVTYVQTWIDSVIWSPDRRTNNDVEGWHYGQDPVPFFFIENSLPHEPQP